MMLIFPENPRAKSVAYMAALVLLVFPVASAFAESPTGLDGYVWLDASGEPLPFQDYDTILEVMASAHLARGTRLQRARLLATELNGLLRPLRCQRGWQA